MTLTLRPHQERIIKRMSDYNKGQVIVPDIGQLLLLLIQLPRQGDHLGEAFVQGPF